MKNIFWALLILMIDVPISLPAGGVIDLIPDWLGLALLFRSAGNLIGESGQFRRIQKWSAGLEIWTGCTWLSRLAWGGGVPVLQYAYRCLILWLLYLLVIAFRETEQRRNVSLGSLWLKHCWIALVVFVLPEVLKMLWPEMVPLWLSLALSVGQLLAMICFLWGIWNTDDEYRKAIALSKHRK